MNGRIKAAAAAALILLPTALPGCDSPDGVNRSTRSTDDPAAFEQAQAQAEEARQDARAAEAAALGNTLEGIEQP